MVEPLNAVKYELIEGEICKLAVGRCFPTPVQEVVAESLCRLLNAQIAHDGSWRLVWRDPKVSAWDDSLMMFRPHIPTVLQCQFLDKDGDIWAVVNIEEKVHEILEIGMTHWVEQCEMAYQWVHNLLFGVMDIREGKDTKMQAKGEALTPTTDQPYATRV